MHKIPLNSEIQMDHSFQAKRPWEELPEWEVGFKFHLILSCSFIRLKNVSTQMTVIKKNKTKTIQRWSKTRKNINH